MRSNSSWGRGGGWAGAGHSSSKKGSRDGAVALLAGVL